MQAKQALKNLGVLSVKRVRTKGKLRLEVVWMPEAWGKTPWNLALWRLVAKVAEIVDTCTPSVVDTRVDEKTANVTEVVAILA